MSSNYSFYMDRISSCPLYGFKSGHELLSVILSCADNDSTLTLEELNSIMKQAEKCHITMMEENYNAGWDE